MQKRHPLCFQLDRPYRLGGRLSRMTKASVSLTAPANNSVMPAPASITLNANAAADVGRSITQVEFFQNNQRIATATTAPYTYQWSNIPAGTYTITAKATDDLGATTTSAPVSVTVNAAPTINITAPTNNASYTAPASVTITANAADNDGTITQVDFYNGTTLVNTDTTPPYHYELTGLAVGSYTLTAVATDNSNATTTSAALNIRDA